MPILNLTNTKWLSVDGAGRPNSGGTIEVWVADGLFTTAATIYSDQVKTSELTNPVTLDDSGRAEIWFEVKVDIREKDKNGNLIGQTLNIDPNAGNAVTQGFNLVQNGSFEVDATSDGQPDSWTISPYVGSAIAITESIVTDGVKALEFNTQAAGTGGGTATSAKFPVTEGSIASVSFSFYATNATTLNTFQINWYDHLDVLQSTSTVTMPASGSVPTSWTNYEEDITVDAAGTQGEIVLTGISSGGSNLTSKAYFDGIKITNAGLATLDTVQILTNKTMDFTAGNLTVGTQNVHGLVMLDTPTSIISGATGLTDNTWQSYSGTALSTLNATHAILYILCNQEVATSIGSVDAEIHARNGSSSVTDRPVGRFINVATTAESRRATFGVECLVELDSNGHFDYKFDNGGNQTWGATITLNGYYV